MKVTKLHRAITVSCLLLTVRSNMKMYVYGVLLVFYFVINKRNLLFTFEHRRSAHSELWGGGAGPPVCFMKAKIH